MIKVNNITKKFGSQMAVDDVSFQLSSGEIVAFLGVNGAGKSTTIKIMTGVLGADSGQVSVFGHDIVADAIEAKKHIGYLPEDNPLYGDMYVKEYLGYVASIYNLNDRKNAVESVIERVGLRKEYKKKIQSLSKGNRQRVGLGQALIHNPGFLILDEPTSGLDPHQQNEIHEILSELGKTRIILFSSHNLHQTISVCNRYIIINNGKIVFDEKAKNVDSIEDIFNKVTNS
ncbi:ABC transporter ATP-binding protein [Dysgonomonas sp. 520]|uniref:ABC transporter ATP-binding protein n=1 Tax=Dysgonomonas sp. 520 TaxID=2302931 RepID=UPI0013D00B32|nr:ATP-binding cassette domain-containing protein [Dysgonomonas sp. 520]NDW08493.1 ATP-binding cassette domain-containing protein [Dysgonomonas sp. 520]